MNEVKIIQLQSLFERFSPNFLGISQLHAQCTSFDVPDLSASGGEWFPLHRFDRVTLYLRDGKDGRGARAITAWTVEGVIIRAWNDEQRERKDIIGKTVEEVTSPKPADEKPARGRKAA